MVIEICNRPYSSAVYRVMTRFHSTLSFTAQAASFLLVTATLWADTSDPKADPKVAMRDIQAPLRPAITENVSANYSYVGGSDLKSGGDGELTEQTYNFRYDVRVPVNDTVGVGFGLGYNRIDFGTPENSFLPDSLESLNVNLLGHYKLSNDWSLFAMFGPRLNLINGWDDIESKSVTWGGAFGAHHEFNKNLSIQFGLGVTPSGDIPIMPILGVKWQFADKWTLNGGFPRTAVDYQLLTNLRLSFETSFSGGTYVTSSTYGTEVGRQELNNRELKYREIRVGIGALYNLTKNVDLDLSTGAVVYREFDFKDTDFDPTVKPAPYVQAGVKVHF